jgi:hypothetical protein
MLLDSLLDSFLEQGLAELKSGNVAVQIGRTFRARRARLSSCRCWKKQILLRSQGKELVGLLRRHDDLGHRNGGCKGSKLIFLPPTPGSGLSRLLNGK